jgi:alanyl-tRNA synthetase
MPKAGVAAGVRRVEAVTGDNALAYLQQLESTLGGVAGALKAHRPRCHARINAVLDQVRSLEKKSPRSRASWHLRKATN